jgi:dienelactone hydrolase
MPSKQLLYYRSKLDDVLQPLPLCVTDDGKAPKPLILDVSPGTIRNLGAAVQGCEKFAQILVSAGESAIIAKPCGRGPGTVYQGPGEVDFFEAVEFICRNFNVDPDRISVTGGSMGGAATWYLASHYPDFFAAAAPFCGYCDYRLWVKPGGTIIRTQEWEHSSWQARDAAFRVGNLSNMALWIVHGAWDTPIGGGVSVQHSRNMSQRLTELGVPHTYTEVPECGHGCMRDDTLAQVLPWLCKQRRKSRPDSVDLTVHTLRHNRSFYLRLDALEHYGAPGRAKARIKGRTLSVSDVENVAALTLGPIARGGRLAVCIGGQNLGQFDLSKEHSFVKRLASRNPSLGTEASRLRPEARRFRSQETPPRHAEMLQAETLKKGGQWNAAGRPNRQNVKGHGCSGPIGDVFFEPVRIVLGTQGSPEENFILQWLVGEWVNQFKKRNGGVHRGIFDGESDYEMQVLEDKRVTDKELETCNLILAGTQASNAVYRKIADRLPVAFGKGTLTLHGREYVGDELGACVLAPSPFNPERYVVVIGGATPKSAAGSTHFGFHLLPDYIVWDRDLVPAWGFSDAEWR